jgi:hypothetical protein
MDKDTAEFLSQLKSTEVAEPKEVSLEAEIFNFLIAQGLGNENGNIPFVMANTIAEAAMKVANGEESRESMRESLDSWIECHMEDEEIGRKRLKKKELALALYVFDRLKIG